MTSPSQCMPNPSSVRMIRSALPGTTRGVSRSSIRSSHWPPWWRASRELPTAARSEPRCRSPVGEGAKRPMYGLNGPAAVPRSRAAGAARVWSAGRRSPVAVVSVAVLTFAPLPALLGLDAQGGHRPRFQALHADFLACLEAIAVRAVVDPREIFVDLADQLALAIARTQLEAEFLFLRRSVVGIGEVRRFVLHVGDSSVYLDHEVALPAFQNLPEVFQLR